MVYILLQFLDKNKFLTEQNDIRLQKEFQVEPIYLNEALKYITNKTFTALLGNNFRCKFCHVYKQTQSDLRFHSKQPHPCDCGECSLSFTNYYSKLLHVWKIHQQVKNYYRLCTQSLLCLSNVNIV